MDFLTRSVESLRGAIPGLLHVEVGEDVSGVDYACDVVLYSQFETQAALDGYAEHPQHLRIQHALVDLRICASRGIRWTMQL